MAGEFDAVTNRYIELVDNSALDLPGSGWSMFAMFYPDTGFTPNTLGYIYSHGAPVSSVSAINIAKSSSGIRVIIDQPAGTLADFTTSNNVVNDQWNAVSVVYNATNVFTTLNGTTTTASPPSIGSITPSGNARIGYAVHAGTRQFNGRICHAAKFNRVLTVDERTRYTSIFVSPDFAQQDKIWHLPIWNSDFTFDQQQVLTVNQVSMAFGPHAPASYPTMTATNLDEAESVPTQDRRVIYVGA